MLRRSDNKGKKQKDFTKPRRNHRSTLGAKFTPHPGPSPEVNLARTKARTNSKDKAKKEENDKVK
jgi:hypothetical protein